MVGRVRSEAAAVLGRVVVDLGVLEGLLASLRQMGDGDEEVLEAALSVRMATAALAPLRQRWADGGAGDSLAGVIGSLLREALAGGSAHVETQSGVVRPCVPGVEPRYQGLVEHAGGWEPIGETAL